MSDDPASRALIDQLVKEAEATYATLLDSEFPAPPGDSPVVELMARHPERILDEARAMPGDDLNALLERLFTKLPAPMWHLFDQAMFLLSAYDGEPDDLEMARLALRFTDAWRRVHEWWLELAEDDKVPPTANLSEMLYDLTQYDISPEPQ